MPLVDTHVHVIAPEGDASYPRAESAAGASWVVSHGVTLEQLLPRFEAAEVEKAVLVQAISGHAFDNSYAIDSAARHPGRLTNVGALDHAAEGAVATLRSWGARGLRGVRLRLPAGEPLDSAPSLQLWQACEETGLPVVVLGLTPVLYPQLTRALDRFAGVKVALDHLGGNPVQGGPPFEVAQPLFDLARYPNLYLKFTTTLLEACEAANVEPTPFLRALVERFGAERLMWGSNYSADHEPKWPYERTVAAARELTSPFSEPEQRLLLGESALTLWPELAA